MNFQMAHEPNIVFLVIYQNFNEEILEQFKENFNAPLYCNTKHLGIMFTELFGDNEVNYTNFRNCLTKYGPENCEIKQITYIDSENDKIPIDSELEFKAAMRVAKEQACYHEQMELSVTINCQVGEKKEKKSFVGQLLNCQANSNLSNLISEDLRPAWSRKDNSKTQTEQIEVKSFAPQQSDNAIKVQETTPTDGFLNNIVLLRHEMNKEIEESMQSPFLIKNCSLKEPEKRNDLDMDKVALAWLTESIEQVKKDIVKELMTSDVAPTWFTTNMQQMKQDVMSELARINNTVESIKATVEEIKVIDMLHKNPGPCMAAISGSHWLSDIERELPVNKSVSTEPKSSSDFAFPPCPAAEEVKPEKIEKRDKHTSTMEMEKKGRVLFGQSSWRHGVKVNRQYAKQQKSDGPKKVAKVQQPQDPNGIPAARERHVHFDRMLSKWERAQTRMESKQHQRKKARVMQKDRLDDGHPDDMPKRRLKSFQVTNVTYFSDDEDSPRGVAAPPGPRPMLVAANEAPLRKKLDKFRQDWIREINDSKGKPDKTSKDGGKQVTGKFWSLDGNGKIVRQDYPFNKACERVANNDSEDHRERPARMKKRCKTIPKEEHEPVHEGSDKVNYLTKENLKHHNARQHVDDKMQSLLDCVQTPSNIASKYDSTSNESIASKETYAVTRELINSEEPINNNNNANEKEESQCASDNVALENQLISIENSSNEAQDASQTNLLENAKTNNDSNYSTNTHDLVGEVNIAVETLSDSDNISIISEQSEKLTFEFVDAAEPTDNFEELNELKIDEVANEEAHDFDMCDVAPPAMHDSEPTSFELLSSSSAHSSVYGEEHQASRVEQASERIVKSTNLIDFEEGDNNEDKKKQMQKDKAADNIFVVAPNGTVYSTMIKNEPAKTNEASSDKGESTWTHMEGIYKITIDEVNKIIG